MLAADQVEELITLVEAFDRGTLIAHFRSYRAGFPLDFTDAFLDSEPVDSLRHIFVAICLQTQRMPTPDAVATDAA
jgi:hypothetical protein